MADAAGKPKAGFYLAIFLVIASLGGYAAWRYTSSSTDGAAQQGDATLDDLKQIVGQAAEAADTNGITTVKEYEYVASQKLPEVKGISNYKEMKERTVKFSINVWAGWAPIIYANEGFSAKKVWKGADGKPFKVEIVLIDDPVAMRDAFAAGEVHIGWATVDMLPLLVQGLASDSRVMPRVVQQIDWSNGGDGIVVRDTIKTMSDLRGKSMVLAQNSPSHFFALNALINAGVQPGEVDFKFTKDAFAAAAAFNGDKSIAAVVSWAPDIYNLEKVQGNKLLVTTGTANKLIADVWYARADFAKDHPDIVEGIVRGIFDAMVELKTQENKGLIVPVEITVYVDRTFDFIIKSPPASVLLKRAAGVASGSGVPNKTKVGKVTKADLTAIAKTKMKDLNARSIEHAARIIAGTARSMGIEIVE